MDEYIGINDFSSSKSMYFSSRGSIATQSIDSWIKDFDNKYLLNNSLSFN